jgi:hypothetical protein
MSTSTRTPEQALADLEARLRSADAPVLSGLNNGLSTDSAAKQLGRVTGNPDPALLALYTWRNGARGAGSEAELMDDARFLPLEEAVKRREFELRLAAENEDLPEFPAATFYDPGWFPILITGAGNLYVVERLGAGRVLLVDREDTADQEELGSSLVDFIDRLAREGRDYQPPPLSETVEVLVGNLKSDRPEDRVRAARELTRKKPPSAFEPLVAMLESEDAEARRYAALLLGQVGDRRAIPILVRCIGRWSGRDVTSAYGGLIAIGPESPLDHLVNVLATGDAELRRAAIKGLQISRDPGAAAAIRPATKDPDPDVRQAAELALRQLGGT